MMFGYGYGNMHSYLGGFGMLLTMLIPLAVIAGIIYLVFKILDKRTNSSQVNAGLQDPLAILKERYAKGEISQDEYQRIKDDLLPQAVGKPSS